jgi:hypothetical protein
VSNSCPIIVPLASVAVFWLPPESRKCLKRLSGDRFESYSAHHLFKHLQVLESPEITSQGPYYLNAAIGSHDVQPI